MGLSMRVVGNACGLKQNKTPPHTNTPKHPPPLCRTEMRLAGSYSSVALSRSRPASSRVGNTRDRSCGRHCGNSCLFLWFTFLVLVLERRGKRRLRWSRRGCCAVLCVCAFGAKACTAHPPNLTARAPAPVAQAADARPHVLVGRAEQLEDVQQLLPLAVAGEQRLLADLLRVCWFVVLSWWQQPRSSTPAAAPLQQHPCSSTPRPPQHHPHRPPRRRPHQLGHDAAHAPHVDRRRVVRRAQQHLGRAVPQGDDLLVLVLLFWFSYWGAFEGWLVA
jgi:hypothetical protein